MIAVWSLLTTVGAAAATSQQAPARPAAPVSRSPAGVYTAAQAVKGQDRYALMCQSCHAPASHASPPFVQSWSGRTLWELFDYIQVEMPMSDPGVLEPEETAELVAYLLRLNGILPGPDALPTNPDTLKTIRFESGASPPEGST